MPPLPTPPSAPPWKTSVDDLIVQVHRQVTTLSLGAQPRISIDLAGRAPILLDRWEFDAFTGKSKEAEQMRRAAAVRGLAREMRIACETLARVDPNDIPVLLELVPKLVRHADELSAYFTRLAEGGDAAQVRRSHLTRDNMNREVDALAKAFEATGNTVHRAGTPGAEGERRPPSFSASGPSSHDAHSPSGAHTWTPPPQDRAWKKAVVPVLFLVAIGAAVFNLMPPRDPRVPFDPGVFQDIAPLERAWRLEDTVCGTVTPAWYAATESRQLELARKMYERAKKDHQASRLTLYQPGGMFIAASISDGDEVIKPRFR